MHYTYLDIIFINFIVVLIAILYFHACLKLNATAGDVSPCPEEGKGLGLASCGQDKMEDAAPHHSTTGSARECKKDGLQNSNSNNENQDLDDGSNDDDTDMMENLSDEEGLDEEEEEEINLSMANDDNDGDISMEEDQNTLRNMSDINSLSGASKMPVKPPYRYVILTIFLITAQHYDHHNNNYNT